MALPWTDFVWTYLRYLSLYGIQGPLTATNTLTVQQPTVGAAVLTLTTVPATGSQPTETSYQNRVTTTDATVTTIHSVACAASTSTGFHGYVTARRTGGSSGTAEDGAYYEVQFLATVTSGTAAIVSSTVTTVAESQAGWDVTVAASGSTVLVKVTGAANNNITWHITGMTNPVST